MLDHYFRPYYQRYFVDPIAHWLNNRISANQITLFAGFTGLLVLPALWFHAQLLAVMLLLISGYCDTLDGTLARLNHTTSAAGTVLDILMDRIVECAVIIALFMVDPLQRSELILLIMASVLICVTSFLVVGIFTPNQSTKSFYYSPGLIERPEAFGFFILMILFPALFKLLAITFIALTLLTVYLRVKEFFNYENASC